MAEIQNNLFDGGYVSGRPSPMARTSDPVTSHESAREIRSSGTLAEHEQAALAIVRLYPGRTGAELDQLAHATRRQISKRLAGLRAKGLVRRGEREEIRSCDVTGSKCVTWWATERPTC